MSKILVLTFILCLGVAIAQPWTPSPSPDFASDIRANSSTNPGFSLPGRLLVDSVKRGLRLDLDATTYSITEILANNTRNVLTLSPSFTVCNSGWTFMPIYDIWTWIAFSSYKGVDVQAKCQIFSYSYASVLSVTGCFSDPSTPVYLTVYENLPTAPKPINLHVDFKKFVPGLQSSQSFLTPAQCVPVPSGADMKSGKESLPTEQSKTTVGSILSLLFSSEMN